MNMIGRLDIEHTKSQLKENRFVYKLSISIKRFLRLGWWPSEH